MALQVGCESWGCEMMRTHGISLTRQKMSSQRGVVSGSEDLVRGSAAVGIPLRRLSICSQLLAIVLNSYPKETPFRASFISSLICVRSTGTYNPKSRPWISQAVRLCYPRSMSTKAALVLQHFHSQTTPVTSEVIHMKHVGLKAKHTPSKTRFSIRQWRLWTTSSQSSPKSRYRKSDKSSAGAIVFIATAWFILLMEETTSGTQRRLIQWLEEVKNPQTTCSQPNCRAPTDIYQYYDERR